MSDMLRIIILFGTFGVLFVGLGVPLILKRVPPNPWYEFRTEKTFSNQNIWYAANRVAGYDLVAVGLVMLATTLIVFLSGEQIGAGRARNILLIVTLASVAGMLLHSFKALSRM